MSFMEGLRGPSPPVSLGMWSSSHNMLMAKGRVFIRQELAIQTLRYPLKVGPGALVKMQRILNCNAWWMHTSVANHAHNKCTRTHAKTCLIFESCIPLNTFEVYGKIYPCGIKYIKNAETFKRPWHIVQEGMPVILRDKRTRLPMQSFEFVSVILPFWRNVPIYHLYYNISSKIKHEWLLK